MRAILDKFATNSRSPITPLESAIKSSILENNKINFNDEYLNIWKAIANQVREDGFVLLESIVGKEFMHAFRNEFKRMIATNSSTKYAVDRHEGSICIRVKPIQSLNKNDFPMIHAFYHMDIFKKISEAFYGVENHKISINNEIFIHQTPATNDPLSGKLHWDRAQTLKFWLYIDDLMPEAGPMAIIKGSSKENRKTRIKMTSKSKSLKGGEDNLVQSQSHNKVVLSGLAGSILIHDTDASHGATPVSPGYIRRIIRGHTRLK
tara:strand:+ start:85984 stop:86772 length:789 start_codon:yes stop_codon:yes gene_type:complete